jgi:hypothetical protein
MSTAEHGLTFPRNTSKSRKGAIPANIKTLTESAKLAAFMDELQKLANVIDDIAVQDAVAKLQKPRPWRTIGQTATMAGLASPVISAGGKFVEGFVDTPGGIRTKALGGAGRVGTTTAGEMAAKSLTTGLGGGVIAAAKEGLDLHNARKTVRNYLGQHSDKLANMSGVTAPATATGLAAPSTRVRSSSNKGQRVGITPIAAKSGVTNSSSGIAVNPRRSVGDAMTAFKA